MPDFTKWWYLSLYFIIPVLAIYGCFRFPGLKKVGIVLLCYAFGIVLGNSGVIPASAMPAQERLADLAVAMALPLLLFSMDVRRWLAVAGKALVSMAAACLAVVIVALALGVLLSRVMPDAWKISGMAVSVYTGGTPNLAAMRAALLVDLETFLIFHAYDTVVSMIYIVFCMTAAQRVFGRLLPAFVPPAAAEDSDGAASESESEALSEFAGLLRMRSWPPLLGLLALAAGIVLCALGLSALVGGHAAAAVGIVTITTLGIAASFVPRARNVRYSFPLGMYVIYVFCCVVGSMVNARVLANLDIPMLLFVCVAVFGSMALHGLFCRFLRIDTDTFIITSVSAVCSPPFVPPVAEALRNRHALLSGITTGIIGYAVGNYLGLASAFLVRMLQ